jgi:hypothetical protein
LKKLLEALEQPGSASASEDAQRQRKSYNSFMASTGQEIASTLARVCVLDGKSLECIKRIVKAAARLWLELGTQRCRFLMVWPQAAINALGSKGDPRTAITLVVQPRVLRIGNSRGEQLDKADEIRGCEGQQRRFSPAKS